MSEPATAILSARGAVYRVALDDTYSPGMYGIAGLNRPDDSALINNVTAAQQQELANQFPILISGIATTQSDIISQVSCLENVKVIYSFGQNFGTLIIRGEVLLGPGGQPNQGALKQIEDFFWKYRVSKHSTPMAVSVASNAFYAYLTGLEVHEVIVDFHILPFVMYGVLLDLSRDDSTLINPNSLVLTGGNITDSAVYQALSARKAALNLPDVTATNAQLPNQSGASTTSFDQQMASTATGGTAGVMTDPNAIIAMKQATGQPLTQEEQIYAMTQTPTGQDVSFSMAAQQSISQSNTDAGNAIVRTYNADQPQYAPVAASPIGVVPLSDSVSPAPATVSALTAPPTSLVPAPATTAPSPEPTVTTNAEGTPSYLPSESTTPAGEAIANGSITNITHFTNFP